MAPIVSPMIATARVIKKTMNPNAKVVFIGPCIAKKKEKDDPTSGFVDEVLTFQELKEMFKTKDISIDNSEDMEFDGPRAHIGRIFPVSGGLLRSAALRGDILENDIIVTEGADRVTEIIEKVEEGKVEARFLDLLFCEGCINGPVMDNDLSVFIRKDIIANYVRNLIEQDSESAAKERLDQLKEIDLTRQFTKENIALPEPTEEQIKEILAQVNKTKPEHELNCGVCGYHTCRDKAIAVFQGLAEIEMCLPYLIERSEKVYQELLEAQERLIKSARMASMGEVAAGVAHEINNPLAGVLTYTKFILKKMQGDHIPATDMQKLRKYLSTMESETIRVSDIVKNLLEFSRPTDPIIEAVSVKKIIQKSLFLVRHQIELQNVEVVENYEDNIPPIMVDFKQIQQVFLNLFINAAQAMDGGGRLTVNACRAGKDGFAEIKVEDTGCGIPENNLGKIFNPFFSTKLEKKGTGLGLSMVYQIVEKHGGSTEVESQVGVGTCFTVKLPIYSIEKQAEQHHVG